MITRALPSNFLKTIFEDSDSHPCASLSMRVDAILVELDNFRLNAKIFATLLDPLLHGADVVLAVKIAEEKDFASLCSLTNEGTFAPGEFSNRKYFGHAHFEADNSYHDQEFESLQVELHLLLNEWHALKKALDDGVTQRDTTSTLGVRISLPDDYEKIDLANCRESLKVHSVWAHTAAMYSEDAPHANYALRAELRGSLE